MASEVNCKQCGEPHTVYALHHMEDYPDDAYERVMRGEGCPTCEWGEKAGEISLSQSMDEGELTQRHQRSLFQTDDDPTKYL